MKPSPRRSLRVGWCGVAIAAVLSACAEPPPEPDGNLAITLDISGRVERRGVRLVHQGDAVHGCTQPRRVRLPTAQQPAPGAQGPPNIVLGYGVHHAPRFGPEVLALSPEWRPYGPQQGFAIEVFPHPSALEAEGPVRIGRAFRITVGTPEGLWERIVAEDDPAAAGRVTIAPDGLSGRFRATGLVLQIPHNRMPESEAIAVSGTWRCPAPD